MVSASGLNSGVKLTFQHNIEGPVFVAGSFNNWSTSAAPMQRADNGSWEIVLDLPPGEHQFRYYANGQWFTDYAADGIERNALGQYNSIISIHETPETPPVAEKHLPSIKLRRPRSRTTQAGLSSGERSVDTRMSPV